MPGLVPIAIVEDRDQKGDFGIAGLIGASSRLERIDYDSWTE